MSALPTAFLDLGIAKTAYDQAATVILPVPFERTTSYGKGTAHGPRALLRASHYVEWYDDELECEPCDAGIHTLAPCLASAHGPEAAIRQIEEAASEHIAAGKFLVGVGGEHSLTLGLVRATARSHSDLGVVQFDAHADLRDSYEGSPYSHACVMKRLLDLGRPSLAVGLRSLSKSEARLIRDQGLAVVWGRELADCESRFDGLLDSLPETVYLTFDIDFFDPAIAPATGTPEPGGGLWDPTLRLLRRLFQRKRVVAMDLVELAPIPGQPATDFLAAKLIYKCLGYRQARKAVDTD